jgi:hypothetical protein
LRVHGRVGSEGREGRDQVGGEGRQVPFRVSSRKWTTTISYFSLNSLNILLEGIFIGNNGITRDGVIITCFNRTWFG